MKKESLLVLVSVILLGACTYGNQRFVSHQSPEELRANAAAVNRAERAERAEYRKERRQEMMDAAEATRRANQGSRTININHRYY